VDRRRLVLICALAVYGLAAVVLLVSPLSPGDVVAALASRVQSLPGLSGVRQGWIEFGANILLFVPLGFLLTGIFRRPWIGVALALALSVGAELVQVLLPARLPSLRDVLANALGAALGAGIAWVFLIRRSRRARRRGTRRVR
jgi:VanZ family protein